MLLTVVAAAPHGADLAAFSRALASGGFLEDPEVEIIVVQPLPNGDTPTDARISAEVLGVQCSIFDLWGAGIRRAHAPAIALLDARCPPAAGWLAAVRPHLPLMVPAMFGPVACGVEPRTANIVGYLVEYGQFAPPLDFALTEVPGLNLIVSHDIACDVLRGGGFVKTRLLETLVRTHRPMPQPIHAAIVEYRKTYGFFEYCLHRYRHARCYAAQRPMPIAFWSRARAVLATPLLPALRTWRIYKSIRRTPAYVGAARRYLHRIIAAETAWALGEFTGYLIGANQTRRLLR